jgi:4-amino-4-deoxy-L-arabinose transferase-like glycosyltransferase
MSSPSLQSPAPQSPPRPRRTPRIAPRITAHRPLVGELLVLALIVGAAAALRLVNLKGVAADPYYDAAVRSMGLSWHNFFFGALEPGATVSLDKPPIDLWPAVLSTKLLGFGTVAMRLPEALAGVAAVVLVYLALRPVFGARAGLAAAAALAVLPIEVITSRSDTTDAVMMALTTLALALVVSAVRTLRTSRLLWAAVVLAIAFNVKLAESWLALPPLGLIALIGLSGARKRQPAAAPQAGAAVTGRQRFRRLPLARGRSSAPVALVAASLVYVAVALSWLAITLVVPAGQQPYAVGSTNGSPWNAAFVFNGTDRLRGSQQLEGATGGFDNAKRYPQATQAERDRIPIAPPAPTRLLARVGPLSGERLGLEVLAALLLGLPALVASWWRRRAPVAGDADGDGAPRDERSLRIERALLSGLALWLVEGIVLFSVIGRLHPRYTEAFVPAVAGMIGIGAAWATARSPDWRRMRALALAVCTIAITAYSAHLLYGTPAIWWVTLAGALGAIAVAAFERARHAALAPLLCCLLAIPLWASVNAVRETVSDANVLGFVPRVELDRLSAYLRAHQGSVHYETAYDAATKMGALVVHDARPVLPLTTVEGRLLTSTARLQRLTAAGRVRYAFLPSPCTAGGGPTDADCSAPAMWIRLNGTDVSRQAGLRPGTLWELAGSGRAR